MPISKKYFFDEKGDARMEVQNMPHWDALERYIFLLSRSSLPADKPWNILDIGSHTGGLLRSMSRSTRGMKIASLAGVEPLEAARTEAQAKIPAGTFYPTLRDVPDQSTDVIISNESLYLIENLDEFASELKRILRPDGGAFIALGSHAENTAWLRWRNRLGELYGHTSYVHQPMDILDSGSRAGFDMEVDLLHHETKESRRYSPSEDGWGEFVSVEEMRKFPLWKYLFIFYPKRSL
jgi:SAM-dependent methyltransferase